MIGVAIINAHVAVWSQMKIGVRDGAYQTMFYTVTGTMVVLVAVGIAFSLATFFRSASLKQDQTGDPALSLRMARVAAPGILLFALSLTFAAFDWIMSLDPHWFSTIFWTASTWS